MILHQIIRHPVTLFIAMAVLIMITHYTSLGVFYVQDDAYAWIASAGWKDYYGTIHTALQYRPNAWFITYLLDQIAPDTVWPLRIAGMFVLWLTGLLTFYVVRALSHNALLASITALLVVVHSAFYSYMTLYLSATMTGLGLIFVLCGVLAVYYLTQKPTSKIYYALTFVSLILALTSYETAIMVLPMMMGVDYLYSDERSMLGTTKRYIPHIVITLIYLYLRKLGISYHAEMGTDTHYTPTLDKFLYNIKYIWHDMLGLHIAGATKVNLLAAYSIAIFAFIGSTLYAHFHQKWRLWLGAIIWIILGALPFLLIDGMALHYAVYAAIGFCVLAGMSFMLVFQKCKVLGVLAVGFVILANILSNTMGYDRNVLSSMGHTGKNIVEQFEALKIDNRNIVLMNMSNHLAWRIYFGHSINIKHRDTPYLFDLPQGQWNDGLVDDPTVIFVENFTDDTMDVQTRLHDITQFYSPDAPLKTIKATKWRPDKNKPVTIIAPENVTLTAQIGGITCTVTGDTQALTFPPRVWAQDDYIMASEQAQLTIQYAMNLPRGAYHQRCSGSVFDHE